MRSNRITMGGLSYDDNNVYYDESDRTGFVQEIETGPGGVRESGGKSAVDLETAEENEERGKRDAEKNNFKYSHTLKMRTFAFERVPVPKSYDPMARANKQRRD